MAGKKFYQRTLVLVKPDGVKRGLVGEVISRFEKAGLKIVGLKMVWLDEEWARKHYPDSLAEKIGAKAKKSFSEEGKDFPWDEREYGMVFLEALRRYITSGPVVAIAIEGPKAIGIVRKIVGDTSPERSAPGTIRADYSVDSYDFANTETRAIYNVVHASDSESAEEEVKSFFKEDELFEYTTVYEDLLSQL